MYYNVLQCCTIYNSEFTALTALTCTALPTFYPCFFPDAFHWPSDPICSFFPFVHFGFRATIRTRREIQCLPYAGFFGWLPSDVGRIFVLSTTSNQFESFIFRSNLTKLSLATQDYIIIHSSYFLEILGRPKCTLTSPRTFKLSSGEPKVIQLVA